MSHRKPPEIRMIPQYEYYVQVAERIVGDVVSGNCEWTGETAKTATGDITQVGHVWMNDPLGKRNSINIAELPDWRDEKWKFKPK